MSKVFSALCAAAALASMSAEATPIRLDGSETNLQSIVNNMTIGGSSSVDVVNDQYAPDESWAINSVFGQGTGMIVMELAGYAGSNRFGVYDVNDPNNRLQLFAGADSAGAAARFAIDTNGHVYRDFTDSGLVFQSAQFGFYLDTPAGLWFSQAHLNSDSADHMVAYQGQGDTIRSPLGGNAYWGADLFLLGWEDLAARNSDEDFNDFVVFVGGVNGVSVPEPGTMGLMGLGLAAIGAMGRRRKRLAVKD